MSEHRCTITASWPYTPRGTTVEIEVPDSYDLDGVATSMNECVSELWASGTLVGRVASLFIKLLIKIGLKNA